MTCQKNEENACIKKHVSEYVCGCEYANVSRQNEGRSWRDINRSESSIKQEEIHAKKNKIGVPRGDSNP